MSRLNLIFMTLCLLVSSMLPTLAAETFRPHGSYLSRSVSNIHEFAQLLRDDRTIAQRFANHYGVSNDAIADYVEQNGQVVTISKPTRVTEFYIDSSGRSHRHQKLLRQGSKILVVRGTPILDMRCGNPIGKTLPSVPSNPKPVAQLPAPVVERAAPLVEELETPAPLPPEVAIVPPPEVAVVPPAPAPVAVSRRDKDQFPWWLPLGGLFFIHNGDDEEETPPPPVIPEASSLVLGFGGMSFVITYLRMRRHR